MVAARSTDSSGLPLALAANNHCVIRAIGFTTLHTQLMLLNIKTSFLGNTAMALSS